MLPVDWPITLVSAALAFAVPLLLAGVGECLVERAGVINIGVEGFMLAAALAAVAASHRTQCAWLGLLAGLAVAGLLAVGYGWLVIYRGANQVVVGTAINLLALGLTGAVFYAITQSLAAGGSVRLAGVKLPSWPVPLLNTIPVLGETVFSGNVLVYTAFSIVPLSEWLIRRTRLGLRLRAVGEYPAAAESAGIDVRRYRLAAVVVGAALAGMGGAFLSIGHVVTFAENMIAGKGFIALALVIFGRWNPWGVLVGALIFSFAWGTGAVLSVQGRGRPEEVILLALPYLATLGALVARSGRSRSPAALGQPYHRA